MEDGFRVGAGPAIQVEFFTYFQMIVDLAIKNDDEVVVFHGLVSAFDINDRKTKVIELQVLLFKQGLLIRSAVDKVFPVRGNIQSESNCSGYAAHGVCV